MMKIAVVGCAHGELNAIYDTVKKVEKEEKIKIDLLICCGDFQCYRDEEDLISMASPAEKYENVKDFQDYYSGRKRAPVLTLFIGGNHEAVNYLWELPYGGWVAQNIYYMGFAGVINFGGLRIGGLSGIFKKYDYNKKHYEMPPFDETSKRSFYHVRKNDATKLKLLREHGIDIFLSHDWPREASYFGDWKKLMEVRPTFREDLEKHNLGSVPAQEILDTVKPKYWLSGHMHTRFSSVVKHSDGSITNFLALSKCFPEEEFFEVLDFPSVSDSRKLILDPEWICILQKGNKIFTMPEKNHQPSDLEIAKFFSQYNNLNVFPFAKSVNGLNNQTKQFCNKFKVFNPCLLKQ